MTMELTKIPSIDFKLSKTESEIYMASQGSALRNYSAKQKTEVAIKVWSYVKMKLGLRSENAMEEQAQILSLSDDLSQFDTMTEDEVFIAWACQHSAGSATFSSLTSSAQNSASVWLLLICAVYIFFCHFLLLFC